MLEFFEEQLGDGWKVYTQPFLNGVRPDFVLLNPAVGVAVFEVKDWDLNAMVYTAAHGRDDACLQARDSAGRTFFVRSPLAQVQGYREEIAQLYLPSLPVKWGIAAITGGVIFTVADQAAALALLEPHIAGIPDQQRPYRPIAGQDQLERGDLLGVFPEARRRQSTVMTAQAAEELRRWLREPDHARDQRRELILDAHQRRLAESRTGTGFRRVRGPAGSGKSAILARRAAILAGEGLEVLVVSYNHTLRTYLADMVVRAGGRRTSITWLGFHEWCKRTMRQAGRGGEYSGLAQRLAMDDTRVLEEELPLATLDSIRAGRTNDAVTRYDAILVDEGQDFRPSWWTALRGVLRDGGEMMLVVDRAQDLYETGGYWTDEVMEGAGFVGPWNELRVSYRMPVALTRLVADFRHRFQPACEGEPPEACAQEQLPFLRLRWNQTRPEAEIDAVIDELDAVVDGGTYSDLNIITATRAAAKDVMRALEERNIHCIGTIGADSWKERQLKHYFFRGDARVKVTPVHNFKGWEAARIIVVLDDPKPSVAYTALSRLLTSDTGSALSVVCSVGAFNGYGTTWPDYRDRRNDPPSAEPEPTRM